MTPANEREDLSAEVLKMVAGLQVTYVGQTKNISNGGSGRRKGEVAKVLLEFALTLKELTRSQEESGTFRDLDKFINQMKSVLENN